MALDLIELLKPMIPIRRNNAVPVHLQVLVGLRFLATGSYRKSVAQEYMHPISQTSASRYISKVVNALNVLAPLFIHFPQTSEERLKVSNG